MTEFDLNALGIWWIPIPLPGSDGQAKINAWAIEDVDGGIALFDCGFEGSESVDALAFGLAEAGATLEDIQRIIISHAHREHCGAARWISNASRRSVAVFASRSEARALRGTIDRVYALRGDDRFVFRHFEATAVELPGHTAGLTALYAEDQGVLFSSDSLVQDCAPGAGLDVPPDDPGALVKAARAYLDSLQRVAALDVRVVLPGRGAPFAGHRRVAGELSAALGRDLDRALPGPPSYRPSQPFAYHGRGTAGAPPSGRERNG